MFYHFFKRKIRLLLLLLGIIMVFTNFQLQAAQPGKTNLAVIGACDLVTIPAQTRLDKNNITLLFRSREDWIKQFPDFEKVYKHSCRYRPSIVDFSKHMVLFLQGTAVKSRPFRARVKSISPGKDSFTVNWCLLEVAQGIAPPPAREQTTAAIVVIERSPAKLVFKYLGYQVPKHSHLVPKMAPPPGRSPAKQPLLK